ncbi:MULTISPECIES: SbcC/MukB-like Walker B domain-containing protein [unclassified Enterococcus]|uniref:SbcC/MukB-like Walker B domain-containing protein n=1 Tax=unclassified Enterococcus TaxID=2608891 RepID=UPI0019055255|nr:MULTISPECIES: SMC family ATPase [unclassified Enterococcus]MBK0036759.1 SMC family ATPase [Enterococcus sp. S52]MBK0069422.1 SMC family ATPase [Enterococcus sp. S53]MBK0140015.1 SMC family ATPase [Enterococcus sp. S76]MBK0143526.1 SMC family ATPase [Enterococcus sp. S77]
MQPKSLQMKNFGPFIDEKLDFSQLQAGGLFLISGKTGAGKTTIFDGMTFALFGETSGNLRSGKEMRSMFASPTEETSVTFTFEHQRFTYQIQRKPEQTLAKKRGDGVTNQTAKVQLTIFDADGKEKKQISKRTEVDAFIKDLLQLDAKQFFQIMMLPQGEFRNFLIASSNEKERVLRNLFGTEMYQQFNEWLKEQVKAQSRKLEQQQLVASQIMERFEWEEEQEVLTVAECLTLWGQDLEKQQIQLQQLLQRKDQTMQEMKAAQEAFYRAKEIENARIERQGLQEKARELHAKKTEIAQKKAQLNQLVWALDHQEIMQQKEERVKEAQQAAQQINETKQQLQEIQQQQISWQDQRSLIDGIKKKQEAASQKVQRIQQQIPLAQRTQAQQEEVAQLEKAAQQQTIELTKINQAQASAKTQAQHLAEEIDTLRGFQAEAVKLVETQAQVEKWQQAKMLFREAEQKAGEQQQIHSELVLEQQQLAASLLELQKTLKQETSQNARMQIARLRLLLEENEPCPVCGSLDHPNTQEHTTYRIEDIIASEQRLEQTQEKLTKIQQQVSANQTLQEQATLRISEWQATSAAAQKQVELAWTAVQQAFAALQPIESQEAITEETTVAELKKRQSFNQQKAASYEEAQKKHQAVNEQLATFNESYQQVSEQVKKAQEARQLAEGKLASLQEQLAGATYEQLQADLGETNGLLMEYTQQIEADARQEAQINEQQAILSEKLKNLQQFFEEKQAAKTKAEQRLTQRLQEAGMTEETMRDLIAQAPQTTVLSEEIKTYEQETAFVQQRLALLDAQLKEQATIDLNQLETAYLQLQTVMEELQQKTVRKQEKVNGNQRLFDELQVIYQQNVEELAQLGQLQQLAETINGENVKKTSLERYVLQQFLTEILDVANERLARLTRGRYQFELADKVGSYRSSTGLEIDIYDDNAGQVRRAHTLSGGESFIAALALAISLADVIQQRAGGIEIEALFIDEGFGSLDEESLEMAMEALEMIENEGRMIGIISHVRELRARILQQVFVETNGSGQSRIRIKE